MSVRKNKKRRKKQRKFRLDLFSLLAAILIEVAKELIVDFIHWLISILIDG